MSGSLVHAAAELRRSCGVWVSCEESARQSLATDFGGLTRKLPGIVVRPATCGQVAGVLRYANRHDLPVNVRAAGHSIGGQTLSDGGLVLETSCLSRVGMPNVARSYIDVEAGAKWSRVVAATLDDGLVPPVLTGTLGTTVGGTHAVAGLGHASHRYGAQVDNCLGMEVVTAQGDIRWCDAETDSELFEHVLCGLGQLAVIVRVRHRLRRHAAFVQRWRFYYRQLPDMLRDLEVLALAGTAHQLSGFGFSVDHRLAFSIAAAFETDHHEDSTWERTLEMIKPDLVRGPVVQSYAEFLIGQPISDGRSARAPLRGAINPWIDVLLPGSQASSVFDLAHRCFSAPLLRNATMFFCPLVRRHFRRPLFMLPDAAYLVLVGIYLTAAQTEARSALAALAAATDAVAASDGKRYVYAWLPFDATAWARHYGIRWPTLCRLKARFDPQMILNRGVIQYNEAPGTVVPAPTAVS